MAEQRPVRHADDEEEPPRERPRRRSAGDKDGRRQSADDQDGRPRSQSVRRSGRLTAAEAAKAGLRQIHELTGKDLEGVTGLEHGDEGWVVGVEVVEDRRIPSSTDVLAIYEAELDDAGDLVSYQRLKRYSRGRGDSAEDA